jgi:hypothetical protein
MFFFFLGDSFRPPCQLSFLVAGKGAVQLFSTTNTPRETVLFFDLQDVYRSKRGGGGVRVRGRTEV